MTLEPAGATWLFDPSAWLPSDRLRRDAMGRPLPDRMQDPYDRELSDSFTRHEVRRRSSEGEPSLPPASAVPAPLTRADRPAPQAAESTLDFCVPVVAPASAVETVGFDFFASATGATTGLPMPPEQVAGPVGAAGAGGWLASSPPLDASFLAVRPFAAVRPAPSVVATATYTKIVDTTNTAPNQSTVFTGFSLPYVSSGNILFDAGYAGGNARGLYTGAVGTAGATLIADTSTTAPGQNLAFTDFNDYALEGSTVAFLASYKTNNAGKGIYTGAASVSGATRIVDFSTPVPGQSAAFSGFSGLGLSGSNLAFWGYYTSGQGIYSGTVGTAGIVRIVDTSMNAPGQNTLFTSISGDPALSGSNIIFRGSFGSSTQGIYTGVVGTTGATRIVDTSMNAPGQSTPFTSFTLPNVKGNNIAFLGYYGSSAEGVYSGTAGTAGATRIVDTSMTAPGQNVNFSDFYRLSLSGSNIAFAAHYGNDNSQGLYAAVAGMAGATRIVDASTTVPGQNSTFYSFGNIFASGSSVAFFAYYNNSYNSQGIFLYRGGTLLDVAETGESLFGSTITRLNLSGDPLDGNDLAFTYTLANGLSGVATFSLVPEPATWLAGALLLGTVGLGLRRRVRAA